MKNEEILNKWKEKRIKKQPHSTLVSGCLNYLHSQGFIAFPYRSLGIRKVRGKFIPIKTNTQGISDILGIIPQTHKPYGIPLAIELKILPDKVKKGGKQEAFLKRWSEMGISLVISSIEELIEEIKKIKEVG